MSLKRFGCWRVLQYSSKSCQAISLSTNEPIDAKAFATKPMIANVRSHDISFVPRSFDFWYQIPGVEC